MQLRPRDAVDAELERVGVLEPVGLPVDEQEPVGAVDLLGVDGVDPAADHLPAQHQRERRLDGMRRTRSANGPACELLDQLLQLGVVLDVRVARGPRARRDRAAPAGRTSSRPRRGTGCRTSPPATAGRGIGRARSAAKASGSSRSRDRAVADRLEGRATPTSSDRSRRASASRRSTSSSHSATRAASSTSRPSSGGLGVDLGDQGRRVDAAPRLLADVGDRPRSRRVHRVVGVGLLLRVGRLAPDGGRPPQPRRGSRAPRAGSRTGRTAWRGSPSSTT